MAGGMTGMFGGGLLLGIMVRFGIIAAIMDGQIWHNSGNHGYRVLFADEKCE